MLFIEITIWVVSLITAYFILKPFFRTAKNWSKIIWFYLILTPFALAFLVFAIYYYYSGQPESFKKGIELLSSNKKILSEIGDYKSYSFFKDSLPKKEDNPARFKVQLNGTAAIIYLRVIMQKDKTENWTLKDFKQDSLVKIQ